jgi:hypothetical protein
MKYHTVLTSALLEGQYTLARQVGWASTKSSAEIRTQPDQSTPMRISVSA